MLKKILCSVIYVMTLSIPGHGQIAGYIQNIQHQSIHVDTMDGRKLMIAIMPTQWDTAFVGQLGRFQTRHGRQLRIVVILASDDSVTTGSPVWDVYERLSTGGIIFTQGIADGDPAGGVRSELLRYLSRKSRNRASDRFAEGSFYFLSESGRMFAQLDKSQSLDSRVADYIVQTIVPGEH